MTFAIDGIAAAFSSETNPLQEIFTDTDSYREKKLAGFDVTYVTKVDFEGSATDRITLLKEGENWKVNDKDGDKPFVEGVIRNISNLKAETFPVQAQDFGFSEPALKITVTMRSHVEGKPGETHEFIVGKETTSGPGQLGRFIAAGDVNEPAIISTGAFKEISPKFEALLKQ